MNNIENKIVEMRFDNEQFEQAVAKTMATLDKFKEKLNFEGAGKGLDKAGKAADDYQYTLQDIGESLNRLEDRFSVMGTIGARVFEKLTDAAMGFVGSKISTVFNDIIGGGNSRAMNLEQAKFQLQGILKNAEEVNRVIYSDILPQLQGTPFSLDQAAVVMGQIAASGKTEAADIQQATRAIAGAAAMTNSDFAEMGRIFTKVAGNGRVMGDTLQEMSSRGLNAAADMAKVMGVTEEEVREMVTKGQISYDIFVETMDKLYGEQAQQSTTMYTGALEDLKAALARIGAEPAAVKLEFLRDAFNALVPAVDVVNGILKTYTSATKSIVKTTNEAGEEVSAYGKEFSGSLAQKVQKMGWAFQSLFVQLDDNHNILRYSEKNKEKLEELGITVQTYTHELEAGTKVTKEQAQALSEMGVDFELVNGELAEGTQLTKEQADQISKMGINVKDLDEVTRKWINGWGQEVDEGEAVMNPDMWRLLTASTKSFVNVMKALGNIVIAVGRGIKAALPAITLEMFANAAEKVEAFTAQLILSEENMERLKWLVQLVFTPLGIALRLVGLAIKAVVGGIQLLWAVIKPVANVIFSIVGAISRSLAQNIGAIVNGIATIGKFLGGVVYSIVSAVYHFLRLDKIFGLLRKGLDKLATLFDKTGKFVGGLTDKIINAFKAAGKYLNDIFHFTDAIAKLRTSLKLLRDIIVQKLHLDKLGEEFKKLGEYIKALFPKGGNLFGAIIEELKKFAKWLGGLVDLEALVNKFTMALAGFFSLIGNYVAPVLGKLVLYLKIAAIRVKEFFKSLNDAGIIAGLINKLKPVGRVKGFIGWLKSTAIPTIKIFWNTVKEFFGIDKLTDVFTGLGNKVKSWWRYLTSANVALTNIGTKVTKKTLSEVFNDKNASLIEKLAMAFSILKTKVGNGLNKLADKIIEFFKTMDAAKLKKLMAGGVAIGSLISYFKTFRKAAAAFDALGKMFEVAKGGLSAIKGFFVGLGKVFKHISVAVQMASIALAVIAIAAAMKIISTIDKQQMLYAGGVIIAAVAVLGIISAVLSKIKIDKGGEKKFMYMAALMIGIGIAIASIAVSLTKVAEIYDPNDWKKMLIIVGSMVILLATLMGVAFVLGKYGKAEAKLGQAGAAMIAIGTGMKVMAEALAMFGSQYIDNPKAWKKALITMGVILGAFVLFAAASNAWSGTAPKIFSAALGMIALSAAVMVMSLAIRMLGTIDPDQMSQGFWTMVAIMGLFITYAALCARANVQKIAGVSMAVLAIGLTLKIISEAMDVVSTMDDKAFSRAVKFLLGIGAAIALFLKFGSIDAGVAGVGLFMVAAGISMVGKAVAELGLMNWKQLAFGLVSVALGFGLLVGAIWVLGKLGEFGENKKGVAMLLGMAVAFALFAAALSILAIVPFDAMVKGIGALAIIVVAMSLALILLSGLGPGMLLVAAAFALLGLTVLALAAAMTLMVMALASLVPLFYALAAADSDKLSAGMQVLTTICQFLSDALKILASGVLALGLAFLVGGIGAIVMAAGIALLGVAFVVAAVGLVVLAGGIIAFAAILDWFFGGGMLESIGNGFAKFGSAIVKGLGGLFSKLKSWFTKDRGEEVTVDFTTGLSDSGKKGSQDFGTNLIGGMEDVPDELKGLIPGYEDAGEALGMAPVDGLSETDGLLEQFMGGQVEGGLSELTGGFGDYKSLVAEYGIELPEQFESSTPEAKKAAKGQTDAVVKELRSKIPTLDKIGESWSTKLQQGAASKKKAVTSTMTGIASSSARELKKPDFQSIGEYAMLGFIKGIKVKVPSVKKATGDAGHSAYKAMQASTGVQSPSWMFAEIGRYTMEGYILGMRSLSRKVNKVTAGIGEDSVDAMSNAVAMVANAMMTDVDFTPTIAPVVDLTNVKDSANQINGFFNNPGLNLGANANMTAMLRNPAFGNQNQQEIASSISSLADKLEAVTDTMNNRQMNNYFSIDGATDPEAFADGIVRRLKMNSRSV